MHEKVEKLPATRMYFGLTRSLPAVLLPAVYQGVFYKLIIEGKNCKFSMQESMVAEFE